MAEEGANAPSAGKYERSSLDPRQASLQAPARQDWAEAGEMQVVVVGGVESEAATGRRGRQNGEITQQPAGKTLQPFCRDVGQARQGDRPLVGPGRGLFPRIGLATNNERPETKDQTTDEQTNMQRPVSGYAAPQESRYFSTGTAQHQQSVSTALSWVRRRRCDVR